LCAVAHAHDTKQPITSSLEAADLIAGSLEMGGAGSRVAVEPPQGSIMASGAAAAGLVGEPRPFAKFRRR